MKISKIRHSRRGFTLIELLVGMTIFTVGITSIFLLLQSTIKSATISRNEIVVANLLREQLELTKFLRDSNVKNFAIWNNGIAEGNFQIYNNFSSTSGVVYQPDGSVDFDNSSLKIDAISDANFDTLSDAEKFEKTQLCVNADKFFVPCASDASLTEKTPFSAYAKISAMKFLDNSGSEKIIEKNGAIQWYTIDARILVRDGGNYREYDAKTQITDWK